MSDPNKMTDEQLDAELRANGIDPHELNVKMLAKIEAAMAAGHDTPQLNEAHAQFKKASVSSANQRADEAFNRGVETSAQWIDDTLSDSAFLAKVLRELKLPTPLTANETEQPRKK